MKLASITIRPGANGGHSVVHEFEPHAMSKSGGMRGGMYMERPPSQEHHFGANEGGKMLAHVTKTLSLKGIKTMATSEGEE